MGRFVVEVRAIIALTVYAAGQTFSLIRIDQSRVLPLGVRTVYDRRSDRRYLYFIVRAILRGAREVRLFGV